MSNVEKLLGTVRDITTFCILHKGRCFNGWEASKIFRFIAFHLLNETILVTRNIDGKITGVAIAWTAKTEEIRRRDEKREPHFEWKLPEPGKALLIADVLGTRSVCGELWKQALNKWPMVERVFAYRRKDGKPMLKEFSMETLNRFYGKECGV